MKKIKNKDLTPTVWDKFFNDLPVPAPLETVAAAEVARLGRNPAQAFQATYVLPYPRGPGLLWAC